MSVSITLRLHLPVVRPASAETDVEYLLFEALEYPHML